MIKTLLTLSIAMASLGAMAQTGSRLTSETFRVYNSGTSSFILKDTSNYQYNTNSGPDEVFSWKYDTLRRLRVTTGSFQNQFRTSQTFDAQNRIVAHYVDSWNVTQNKWETGSKDALTYESHGKIATWESQSPVSNGWDTYSRSEHTYNANGDRIETIMLEKSVGSSAPLTNNLRYLNVYNAFGALQSDTSFVWDLSVWQYNNCRVYYYTGNKLTTRVSYTPNISSGIFEIHDSTFFQYDTHGNQIGAQTKIFLSGVWKDFDTNTFVYDSVGNVIEWTTISPENGFGFQLLNTYNNFKQVTSTTRKTWNAGTNQFEFGVNDGTWNYYYAPYFTAIQEEPDPIGIIRVFPMPASNTMTLDFNWNETQPATILLFDMTGKLAAQWTTPTAKQHTQILDISSIPSGIYMLKVMGTKGVMSRQVNIVK